MGFGAGLGLPNIKRSSDLFEIETRVGRGTRIRSTILQDAAHAAAVPSERGTRTAALSVQSALCRKCMRCILACPTAALRVRSGGPSLRPELCIGCTACAAACTDGVFDIGGEVTAGGAEGLLVVPEGAVLVLPRDFLSGFPMDDAPARVLSALQRIGFSDVRLTDEWEAALRDEARAHARRGEAPAPLVPPVCPAVVTLVESRFPSLIPNLGPWLSPLEAAGEEFPLRPVVLVAACPAQFAAAHRASLTARLTVIAPLRLAELLRPGSAQRPAQARAAADVAHAAGEPARGAGSSR